MRYIASELEISPAYLSYMVNGKRPWRKDLYQRYVGVVNTYVNNRNTPSTDLATIEGAGSVRPLHPMQVRYLAALRPDVRRIAQPLCPYKVRTTPGTSLSEPGRSASPTGSNA